MIAAWSSNTHSDVNLDEVCLILVVVEYVFCLYILCFNICVIRWLIYLLIVHRSACIYNMEWNRVFCSKCDKALTICDTEVTNVYTTSAWWPYNLIKFVWNIYEEYPWLNNFDLKLKSRNYRMFITGVPYPVVYVCCQDLKYNPGLFSRCWNQEAIRYLDDFVVCWCSFQKLRAPFWRIAMESWLRGPPQRLLKVKLWD